MKLTKPGTEPFNQLVAMIAGIKRNAVAYVDAITNSRRASQALVIAEQFSALRAQVARLAPQPGVSDIAKQLYGGEFDKDIKDLDAKLNDVLESLYSSIPTDASNHVLTIVFDGQAVRHVELPAADCTVLAQKIKAVADVID